MVIVNEQEVDEYTLKAVWLAEIINFIDWSKSNIDSYDYLRISITDKNSFNWQLESTHWGQPINREEVQIELANNLADTNPLDVLFIPEGSPDKTISVVNNCSNTKTLTARGENGFAEKRAHINFIIINNKVGFEIPEHVTRKSIYYMNFRLLNISKFVIPLKFNDLV